MLKEIDKGNWIIPPWDDRYGKIGHLWRKYDWNSLVYNDRASTYYYIPPELVSNEYIYNTKVFKDSRKIIDSYDNWVFRRDAERIMQYCLGLSMQEYFDLLILKINNKEDRPRCIICGSRIYFYSIYFGYGSPYTSWVTKKTLSCSKSCSDKLRWMDEDDYFNSEEFRNILSDTAHYLWEEGIFNYDSIYDLSEQWKGEYGEFRKEEYRKRLRDPKFRAKMDRNSFLAKGDEDDECVFYVTYTRGGYLKYGITQNLYGRCISSYKEDPYINPHVIFTSTRLEVSNMEYWIKITSNSLESMDKSDLNYLFNLIRIYLTERPSVNI